MKIIRRIPWDDVRDGSYKFSITGETTILSESDAAEMYRNHDYDGLELSRMKWRGIVEVLEMLENSIQSRCGLCFEARNCEYCIPQMRGCDCGDDYDGYDDIPYVKASRGIEEASNSADQMLEILNKATVNDYRLENDL